MVFAINPDEPNTGKNRTVDTFRKNALVEAFADLLFGNITTTTSTASASAYHATESCSAPYGNSLAAAAVSSDSNGSTQDLVNKLNDLAPIVFGLLGGIVVLLLAILGVGIAMCVKRGRSVGRQINPSYVPVRHQEVTPFPGPESEHYSDKAYKYTDA